MRSSMEVRDRLRHSRYLYRLLLLVLLLDATTLHNRTTFERWTCTSLFSKHWITAKACVCHEVFSTSYRVSNAILWEEKMAKFICKTENRVYKCARCARCEHGDHACCTISENTTEENARVDIRLGDVPFRKLDMPHNSLFYVLLWPVPRQIKN